MRDQDKVRKRKGFKVTPNSSEQILVICPQHPDTTLPLASPGALEGLISGAVGYLELGMNELK